MKDVLLNVVVRNAHQQGAGVLVFDLCSSGGEQLPVFEAGAHVDVHLPGGLIRQYSLCGDPADNGRYRLIHSGQLKITRRKHVPVHCRLHRIS